MFPCQGKLCRIEAGLTRAQKKIVSNIKTKNNFCVIEWHEV